MRTARARTVLASLLAASLLAGCGSDPTTTAPNPQAQRGAAVARDKGCTSCHGTNGEGGTGPPWQNIWGTTVQLDDGTTVTVDADYIRRSILDPSDQIVDGYPNLMPALSLDDHEIEAITAYIESLNNNHD